MIGTLLNVATVLVGGGLGTLTGDRLPVRARESLLCGLGLFSVVIGVKMALEPNSNSLVTLGGLLVGTLLGEWWRIEDRLKHLGAWIEARVSSGATEEGTARFIKGFVTASLVFCVGPMTVLGSIQDGLKGDFELLAIKSVLDGFTALAFSAAMGVGVVFSVVVILVYQGAITLLAAQAQALVANPMIIGAMTAVGGVLVVGIGIGALLELRPIRVANMLPALAVAPLIVALLHAMGIAGF